MTWALLRDLKTNEREFGKEFEGGGARSAKHLVDERVRLLMALEKAGI